jgi:hypothetical protein
MASTSQIMGANAPIEENPYSKALEMLSLQRPVQSISGTLKQQQHHNKHQRIMMTELIRDQAV